MTNAIHHNRTAPANANVRTAVEKSDTKPALAPATPLQEANMAAAKAQSGSSDSLFLSNVADKVKEQPAFDRVKVESIKKAIREGSYALNPRSIAESFVATESAIGS